MTTYFTIPGYGGSGIDHWQSYFDQKLDHCYRIQQKSWTEAVMTDWVESIEQHLNNQDLSNTILITHSLGGIACLHWFQKYQKSVKGVLIVAPPDLESPAEDLGIEGFMPIPQTQLPFPSIVVCSSNDKWMSVERSRHFARCWGSELVILDQAGHINGEAGFGPWNEGLDLLKKLR